MVTTDEETLIKNFLENEIIKGGLLSLDTKEITIPIEKIIEKLPIELYNKYKNKINKLEKEFTKIFNELDTVKQVTSSDGRIILINIKQRIDDITKNVDKTGLSKIKVIASSGLLNNNIFFHTVFLDNDGKYYPYVITETKDFIQVIDNINQLKKKGIKQFQEDDCFFYFNYKNKRYKYLVEDLFLKDTYRIFTVNNAVIPLIKKRYTDKRVYDEMLKLRKEYYDHHNKEIYDVLNAFDIQTYIKYIFGKPFYIIPIGSEDTGKSTCQKVSARLQFNGKFCGKGTVAVNARLVHFLSININQDEFDKLGKDERKQFIGSANTGLYPDGTYEFTNINKRKLKDQITILSTYAVRSFSANSLREFDKSFLSRCYLLNAVRQGRKLKDINILLQEDEYKFQDIRNKMFCYCLFNGKKIKQDIDKIRDKLEEKGTFGRETDKNSVILGIVKHFKGNYSTVEKHLENIAGVTKEERKLTNDALTLEFIKSKFIKKNPIVEVSNSEIRKYICKELNIDINSDKAPSPRTIGAILRRYNLVEKEENICRKPTGFHYILSRDDFNDRLRRYGYSDLLDKEETKNLSSFSSFNSFSSSDNEHNEGNEGNEHRFVDKELKDET